MYIKGFDKDLKCIGFQFEVGGAYDTGYKKEELELCSETVFHFCDSLEKVHEYYDCSNEENRYCEIEVLGELIYDENKCGSNKIRVVREIIGEELEILKIESQVLRIFTKKLVLFWSLFNEVNFESFSVNFHNHQLIFLRNFHISAKI